MSTIHPDLAALTARYNELYKSATDGHIAPQDALAALSGLSVTDGSGAVWRISADGEFLRAPFAGGPPQKAPVTEYVDPATTVSNPEIGQYNVGPNQQPTSPTWETTPAPRQPGGAVPGFGPATATPTAPVAAQAPVTFGQTAASAFASAPQPDPFSATPPPAAGDPFASAPAHTAFPAPAAGPPAALGNTFEDRPAKSLSKAEERLAKRRTRTGPAPLTGFLARNKMLVIIAVLGAALLAFATTRGGGDASELPSLEEAPGFAAPATPSAPATRPSAETLPVQSTPSPEEERKVLAALESGDRTTIKAVTAGKPAADALAKSAAFFAGLDKAGLSIVRGPLAASGAGAVQQWDIQDGSKTVLRLKVSWVSAGGAWKLAAVPVP